ncbi:hypothetical protein GCK72_020144 [Caenorhabditis remanei]|uniref:G protein-coupled receptor n=1 Tax=Caenorhabditis remanei TaxID=31234 RepID=A0A6A5GEB6_CAERE|nr:hypothetical protein GCK72_020144 [Caenorhabditis remanei]KAF1753587.1 hypothetical protein GCK72_020144 [Caenorhabditis remanei]
MGMLLCGPNQETTELVSETILESFGEPIEHFEYLGGPMYDISKNGTITPNYHFLSAAGFMTATVSVSFAIIIFCAVKCYSIIKKMISSTTISSKSRSLQSQLFYALVTQIIIPTIVLDLPLTIFFALNLANNGIEGNSGYLSFIVTLYPNVSPRKLILKNWPQLLICITGTQVPMANLA